MPKNMTPTQLSSHNFSSKLNGAQTKLQAEGREISKRKHGLAAKVASESLAVNFINYKHDLKRYIVWPAPQPQPKVWHEPHMLLATLVSCFSSQHLSTQVVAVQKNNLAQVRAHSKPTSHKSRATNQSIRTLDMQGGCKAIALLFPLARLLSVPCEKKDPAANYHDNCQ